MKKKLLIHMAKDRNGGEFRRIARLSKDSDLILGTDTYELVFLPVRLIRCLPSLRNNQLGVKLYLLPCLLPFTRFRIVLKINNVIARMVAKCIYHKLKPDVVWGETLGGNTIAVTLPAQKYIADFHGASPEESNYFRPNSDGLRKSNLMEKEVLNKADAIVVQSLAMKEHLIKKHKEVNANKIVVYHCGVDADMFDYRKVDVHVKRAEFGFADSDIIFSYIGGTNKWQMLYPTLDVFHAVKQFLPKAKMQLILQGDSAPYSEYCKNKGIQDVIIVQNVPFDHVYERISISDFAWLLRENIILNQVASPTKLGEYLSCGQIIITTDVVDSWSWLNRQDVIVIDPLSPKASAVVILDYIHEHENYSAFKPKMRALGVNNLSSEKDRNRLKDLVDILK